MNMIRREKSDEPAGSQYLRKQGLKAKSKHETTCSKQEQNTRQSSVNALSSVLDSSMVRKEDDMKMGDLLREDATKNLKHSREVTATVVAMKPGNSEGAKGGRKANPFTKWKWEEEPARVPVKDKQVGEALNKYGAEPLIWSERMLAALDKGVKGNKWFSLIDKVYSERTLELAWEKVRINAGACGIDGTTIETFRKDSQSRLLAVREHLKQGTYQPKPVKRVMIPKLGSAEKRPLGIPTVRDRVVQTALKMVIEPIFEKEFAPQSYGFRPGRGCKDALRQVDKLLKSGYHHVIDADLKSYFDTIPHERLMELVAERIADGRVLTLNEQYLKQGIIEESKEWEAGEEGSPQGAVISPLLGNLYLNPLDWLMANDRIEMVRYADDFIVLCKSTSEAKQALEKIQQWCDKVKLILHPEKTKIVDMSAEKATLDFLGYTFYRSKKGTIKRRVRLKSEKKFRSKIKPLTKRSNGRSIEHIIALVNPILKGWYGYFKHTTQGYLRERDGWVRKRLREILRRRQGKKRRAHGSENYQWPNHYFRKLGLFSLEDAVKKELANLCRGATC